MAEAKVSVFILALVGCERDALLALLEDSGDLSQPLRSIKEQLANPLERYTA
jgi:hypothetical protein